MSVRLARARGESPVASACLLEMSGHRCLSRTAVQRPYSDVGEADAPADTAATTVTDPKLDRPMAPRFRVTYATLSADNDDLHTGYEQGLQTARSLVRQHPAGLRGDGESRTTGETSEVRSPVDTSSFSAAKLYDCLRDAGLPAGVLHVVPGGDEVGQGLVSNADVDGLTFTGSYAVGMSIYRSFATSYPKPVVCEMGGKNPTIVSRKADLDLAAAGIVRSAFGFFSRRAATRFRPTLSYITAAIESRLRVCAHEVPPSVRWPTLSRCAGRPQPSPAMLAARSSCTRAG